MEEDGAGAKLQRFLQWLQVNGVELRGCEIRHCSPKIGKGIFSANQSKDGILLVVPLDLAITPMRVLQDPVLGPKCRAMLDEGDVDDRFLMILLLTLERLRKESTWKPYLDILPTNFGNPLWFTEDELLELKGTTLYRATELQKKSLQAVFEDKVKHLVKELLPLEGESEREVCFEDFLWANSVFWTRALNIPFPRIYVFPQVPRCQEAGCLPFNKDDGAASAQTSGEVPSHREHMEVSHSCREEKVITEKQSSSPQLETLWVEGLVPGIDFCNHDIRAAATWEIDRTGSTTGIPSSMYLLSAEEHAFESEKEICISYGNKGNEELLYLYGFVINENPDDYLMVHYPIEAFNRVPFSDSKAELLDIQKAEMRCLLPRRLLEQGFFSSSPLQEEKNANLKQQSCNYSWSGRRKMPSYLSKLVFPEDFLAALRTIAMQESELLMVLSLLEELAGPGEERQPSDTEVRAAVWEACGDSGALQLLVDLLSLKMMELEEGTGTEASDTELLEKAVVSDIMENVRYNQFLSKLGTDLTSANTYNAKDAHARKALVQWISSKTSTESLSSGLHSKNAGYESGEKVVMSKNRWSSIVYRRGQKQLTTKFLKEAEHALQLCLREH